MDDERTRPDRALEYPPSVTGFKLRGSIERIQVIAVGRAIRDLGTLRRS